ncbi:MFS transporter [Ilumatobacter sp.]|uniref:MFS transporter n=1 Tax=Ilumatobacter sp. TaxID=1967498 RepID=UPI003B51C7A4
MTSVDEPVDGPPETDVAPGADDDTGGGGDERSRTFSELLRDSVFAPFFFSNAVSNTGNWFQNVAAGIVVYDLTGSNTAVGAVSMLQFTATMLLTPLAGRLTDRVDRRWMLFCGQFVAFLGALGLAITVVVVGIDDLPGPWPIYAATAVIGIGAAIILPSLQAVVPALVPRADLDRAITLNSMTFNIARGVGPVAAGAVIAAFGAAWAFGINTLTFVPLLVVLAIIRPGGAVRPDDEPAHDAEGGTTVVDAVRWVRAHPTVLVLLVGTLGVGWTSDPFSTLMPAVSDGFGYGETVVGLLVGAFGLGAALTAPATDRIRDRLGRGRVSATGLAVSSVGLAVIALAPIVHLALLGALVAGSGFLLGVTSTNTELQRGIPEELRGRVMALWSVAFLGCRPIAALVDGSIADATSPSVALGVAAAVAATTSAFLFRRQPRGAEIAGAGS